jgi:hypothetical protein
MGFYLLLITQSVKNLFHSPTSARPRKRGTRLRHIGPIGLRVALPANFVTADLQKLFLQKEHVHAYDFHSLRRFPRTALAVDCTHSRY